LEEALLALTHTIAHLPRTQEISPDAERIGILEHTVTNLDGFARSLPSASWYHAHEDRSTVLDQRVNELERLCAQLVWDRGDHPADGTSPPPYGTKVPVAQPVGGAPSYLGRSSDAL
jgi:hypothetical protein